MTAVGAVLADHPVVILVDNCEHLLPGIAELVAGLAASSSGVRVVATSREALGLRAKECARSTRSRSPRPTPPWTRSRSPTRNVVPRPAADEPGNRAVEPR